MIKEQIDSLIKEAMKSKSDNLSTLRMIKSELGVYEKSGKEYTEEGELQVLFTMKKKLNQALDAYKSINDEKQIENCLKEIQVVESFLPKMMSIEEIKAYINEENIPNWETLPLNAIKGIMFKNLKGKADSKDINEVLKTLNE